jgi:hypothetical protein
MSASTERGREDPAARLRAAERLLRESGYPAAAVALLGAAITRASHRRQPQESGPQPG